MAEPGRLIIPDEAAAPAQPAPHKNPPLPKQVEILDVICHRSWNAAVEYEQRTVATMDPRTGTPKIAPQLVQVSSLKAHPCVTKSCMQWDPAKKLCKERVELDLRCELAEMQLKVARAQLAALESKAPVAA